MLIFIFFFSRMGAIKIALMNTVGDTAIGKGNLSYRVSDKITAPEFVNVSAIELKFVLLSY